MSLFEGLIVLAVVVSAAFFVEEMTNHWRSELALYGVLLIVGSASAFFVYGAAVDKLHDLRSRIARWKSSRQK